jgi:murein DD-endopeptidase MepM/ murein hydrolase activator NlpD
MAALLQQPAGRADTLSPDQQRLQQILAHRHYWKHQLRTQKLQERRLEQQLYVTQTKLGAKQRQLTSQRTRAAARQAVLLGLIQTDQQKIASVRGQLAATRTEYVRVHRESAGLLLQLRQLKAEIHRQLGHVRAALIQMYELSQVSPLEQVLEAKNLTALLQQQSFVTQIGDRDRAILQQARAERIAVYRVAKVYIDKMVQLKGLQAQEKTQLAVVVVETQHEDLLLLKEQRLTQRRQQSIARQQAGIAALAQQEQKQLADAGASVQTAKQMIVQDQRAAEEVAFLIGQQTGTVPNVGGPADVLIWPIHGVITQLFGPSSYAFEPPLTYHGVSYAHFHTGLDIAAPFQTPIRAAAPGKVIFASLMVPGQPSLSYGLCVIIMHTPHLATLYAHMDLSLGLAVKVGDFVTAGQVIGYEGMTGNTTGPHLHFEVRIDGQFVNPLNYLPANGN